jgi:hypothetical protein
MASRHSPIDSYSRRLLVKTARRGFRFAKKINLGYGRRLASRIRLVSVISIAFVPQGAMIHACVWGFAVAISLPFFGSP